MKSKKRILIVDDNNDIRNAISEYLLIEGFEIGIAENGVNALKLFIDKDFDLVLTDFQMPYMDGLKLACEIKKVNPKTLIIIMSGNIHTNLQTKYVADYIIAKPFGFDKIHNLINYAFGSEAQKQPQFN